jgi:site-specific DNA-methyltransferase (adenine-specific)
MADTALARRAPRNRTIGLSAVERDLYQTRLLHLRGRASLSEIENRTINEDLFDVLDLLPESFADLIFIDPPYNLTKSFNTTVFRERSLDEYAAWLESWLAKLVRTLRPDGTVYICGDWRSSAAIHSVAGKHLIVRSRITWEREKGRGAKANWKNCSEDIWFCTASEKYTFQAEAVKLRRRVIAPYTHPGGQPKDWERTQQGDYRNTFASNLWTDLTVPFWSMPENTDHPAQKPEKLLARIILASSRPNQVVFDPFLGSGTTSVVAKKLGRRYVGIEVDPVYCCLAEKRLARACAGKTIQGYAEGVFWERNSRPREERVASGRSSEASLPLFPSSVEGQ